MIPLRGAVGSIGIVGSASRSHVGRVRQVNEDRVLDLPDHGLWAVADGMGGHYGGDLAAQSVATALRRLADGGGRLCPASVAQALEAANREIFDRGGNAGATVVALNAHGSYVNIVWAGDSRCYRIRDGVPWQITRDHSVVQELIDAGLITAAAADRHPQANVITRALGVNAICELESSLLDLEPGDRFLLCSDGLSRTLGAGDIDDAPIEALADRLLGQALARDGTDNISLVLVDFER